MSTYIKKTHRFIWDIAPNESDTEGSGYILCDPKERIADPKYSSSWSDVTCLSCLEIRKDGLDG